MSDSNNFDVAGLKSLELTQKLQVTNATGKSNQVTSADKAPESIRQLEITHNSVDVAIRKSEETISPSKLAELIRELQDKIPNTASKGLRFQMDPILQRPIVSVVDKESGAVIRQLPPEEVVRAARNIEIMKGILFDDIS